MFSRIQHVRIYKYIYTYDEDTVFAQLIRLCVGITAIAATQLTTNSEPLPAFPVGRRRGDG